MWSNNLKFYKDVTLNEDIVVQVGYNRTGTIVDNFYDEATDDISAVGQDNIMLGLSYVF